MIPGYFVCNEKFFQTSETILTHQNRAFLYGDGLFETIRCLGTQPSSLDIHTERLFKGMRTLKMNIPGNFKQTINTYIEKLLNKNRIFKGARIRLTVFRDNGGLYTPETNNISWVMESGSLENEKFVLETKGLAVDIFDTVHKPVNPLSNLKTTNALIYVMAGLYRKENKLDECLILNQFGRICESISSNVFIVKDKLILTPPLTEGCIEGTMRHTVINMVHELGFEVSERAILEKNLIEADEVFLTNAIQGVKWVSAYKDRRYYNFAARKLIAALNEKK